MSIQEGYPDKDNLGLSESFSVEDLYEPSPDQLKDLDGGFDILLDYATFHRMMNSGEDTDYGDYVNGVMFEAYADRGNTYAAFSWHDKNGQLEHYQLGRDPLGDRTVIRTTTIPHDNGEVDLVVLTRNTDPHMPTRYRSARGILVGDKIVTTGETMERELASLSSGGVTGLTKELQAIYDRIHVSENVAPAVPEQTQPEQVDQIQLSIPQQKEAPQPKKESWFVRTLGRLMFGKEEQ